jgi:hypothetical protein
LSYTYNQVGNITEIEDSAASEVLEYFYDNLNRLTGVEINAVVKEKFDHDPGTGALSAYSVNQGTPREYDYHTSIPHAVEYLTQGQTTLAAYTYDTTPTSIA